MQSATRTAAPSSNWEQLKKKLEKNRTKPPAKKIKMPLNGKRKAALGSLARYAHEIQEKAGESSSSSRTLVEVNAPSHAREAVKLLPMPTESALITELRGMVAGKATLSESKKAPGNYVAIDCEMVGLGHKGSESAVARVSIVNYHGHVLLDTFVSPRPGEQVTDFRTWISGVREEDLRGAPSFTDVQKRVSDLITGRILVGHAIGNDLQALLLSHPGTMIRDTQKSKTFREKAKTKHPGLKRLVEMELGIQIQKGSHSSVTDARATMALFRLCKGDWDVPPPRPQKKAKEQATGAAGPTLGKRKRTGEDDEEDEGQEDASTRPKKNFPGGGRKGISSGLSVVIHRRGERDVVGRRNTSVTANAAGGGGKWWEDSAK